VFGRQQRSRSAPHCCFSFVLHFAGLRILFHAPSLLRAGKPNAFVHFLARIARRPSRLGVVATRGSGRYRSSKPCPLTIRSSGLRVSARCFLLRLRPQPLSSSVSRHKLFGSVAGRRNRFRMASLNRLCFVFPFAGLRL
jgi:hypothetical protein